MTSREDYEKSYNYLNDLSKGLTLESITINFNKLDEKSEAELRDLLNRFTVRRKGEIWRSVLSGAHNGYLG